MQLIPFFLGHSSSYGSSYNRKKRSAEATPEDLVHVLGLISEMEEHLRRVAGPAEQLLWQRPCGLHMLLCRALAGRNELNEDRVKVIDDIFERAK